MDELQQRTILSKLGWDAKWEARFVALPKGDLQPGRVAVEDKLGYIVFIAEGEVRARISGKLMHDTRRADLPKVGDWVALNVISEEEKGVIHHVLPRETKFSRKTSGKDIEEQVIVTNVDIAFLVQALDRTFNPRLLERHLMMVLEGGIKPVVVLNKADLCDNVSESVREVEKAAGNSPVLAVSAKTRRAIDRIAKLIKPGETVVFIGPSGVGKSTLINDLVGDDIQATTEVRDSDSKGRHTTTWRELIVLPNGGLVIDTPGMREFHVWLSGGGISEAFPDIEALSFKCHFTTCSHTSEKRCAVLEAVATGELPRERYNNFLKLRHELEFLGKARQGRVRAGRGAQERYTRKTRR